MLKNKGFTLIELMIVIAIIGILASIAIPNFIAYRDKSFCRRAEIDAKTVANAIYEYFSVPTNTTISNYTALGINVGQNNGGITVTSTNPTLNITIEVQDFTNRCPENYRNAMSSILNPWTYWNGHTFVKLIRITD